MDKEHGDNKQSREDAKKSTETNVFSAIHNQIEALETDINMEHAIYNSLIIYVNTITEDMTTQLPKVDFGLWSILKETISDQKSTMAWIIKDTLIKNKFINTYISGHNYETIGSKEYPKPIYTVEYAFSKDTLPIFFKACTAAKKAFISAIEKKCNDAQMTILKTIVPQLHDDITVSVLKKNKNIATSFKKKLHGFLGTLTQYIWLQYAKHVTNWTLPPKTRSSSQKLDKLFREEFSV